MLLVGAGLFVTSFVKLTRVDLGIDVNNTLTVRVFPRVVFDAPDRTRRWRAPATP